MGTRIIIAAIISTLLISCSCGGKRKKVEDRAPEKIEEPASKRQNDVAVPDSNGIVRIEPVEGKGVAVIEKKATQSVELQFESQGYKELRGVLTSGDPAANIRFAQIILPDGEADGPFGKEIKYGLQGDGIYRLRISENIMAGDPWEGEFTVNLTLLKQ